MQWGIGIDFMCLLILNAYVLSIILSRYILF
jgi:hypothetical protein